MPFHFPFTTPFFNYRYPRYISNQSYLNSNKISHNNSSTINQNIIPNHSYNTDTQYNSCSNLNSSTNHNYDDTNCTSSYDSDSDYFFEILGLKLYFDDVLIICILFFLYSEGVKDDELFLCLILLLLT